MQTRRVFMKTSSLGAVALVSGNRAPAFIQDMKKMKIGQLGLGSHNFLGRFANPPSDFKEEVRCKPYAVWDDVPGVAEAMLKRGFEKVIDDPIELVRECDAVHVEHADYRKVLELARPALEAGKPVFINRPFAASIADAEEIVRLAEVYDAPLMSASSLEFQPEVEEMRNFSREKGPVRIYEAYCPEMHFTWMFPHVINYAHAAFGGEIESAYFTGDYAIDLGAWIGKKREFGAAVCILTYKPVNNHPPIIGMNHIGTYPAKFHVTVYAKDESRTFAAGSKLFYHMFVTLHEFYSKRIIPRPYGAILEQHRALVAANVSRLTGHAVKLDVLGGDDALPYSPETRRFVIRHILNKK